MTTAPMLPRVEARILTLRGQRVMVDADLAELYGVPTRRLNEQVKRNAGRFPADFMFQLNASEKAEVIANCDHLSKLKFSKTLPFVFTEHGAIQAANVLARSLSDLGVVGCKSTAAAHFSPASCPIDRLWGGEAGENCARWGRFSLSTPQVRQTPSAQAVKMGIYVVRAFVQLRQASLVHADLDRRLTELQERTERLELSHDTFSHSTRAQLRQVLDALRQLMSPTEPPKRPIGFVYPKDKGSAPGGNKKKV